MARFVSLISVTAIIASTTIFCLETMPAFKEGTEECRNAMLIYLRKNDPYSGSILSQQAFIIMRFKGDRFRAT